MTREQMIDWMLSMIPENMDFLNQGGASYPGEIRYLEAVIRPLWGVLPLLCKEEKEEIKEREELQRCFSRFHALVQQQKLPEICRPVRQIVVETGALSYGLGIYKEKFLALFTKEERIYLLNWLRTVNTVELPENNWLFFRVLLNTALEANGLKGDKFCLEADLKKIHSWYLGDGWYSDGETKQKDYYVAFGFHYYGLLYARMVQDKHAELFLERARCFAAQFILWFDAQGRSLPFGRSLTYRFAHGSFWCNFLLSGAWKGTALTMEIVKGLIDRNLEFWMKQPIQQPQSGLLTIGYGYANLLLSEDYNAPGSPFWSFKTFTLLEYPQGHSFWKCREEVYPKKDIMIDQPAAGFLGRISREGKHHVFLSAQQYRANPLLYHAQEKYGKFAYSTYFGFNLTRDIRDIRQFAVDNALALSVRGYAQYTAREVITDSRREEVYALSQWETPFAKVCTYLIPLDNDAHVRIHELWCFADVEAVEGGFPLFDWNPKVQNVRLSEHGAEMKNRYGLSRITDLLGNRRPGAVSQGPNTNIYSCEPNGIPALSAELIKGKHTLACVVRGVPGNMENIEDGEIPDTAKEEKVTLAVKENGWEIRYGGEKITVARVKHE